MPLPLVPPVIVIQDALLLAVHVQPAPTVTATVPEKVPAGAFDEVGEIVAMHGAPACVMVKVLPPIVRIPVRGVLAVLGATL